MAAEGVGAASAVRPGADGGGAVVGVSGGGMAAGRASVRRKADGQGSAAFESDMGWAVGAVFASGLRVEDGAVVSVVC